MLTITPDDRLLASELGLFLVRQPVTEEDHVEAQHPNAIRVPETWLVRSVLTNKPLGRLRFTSVDCLYASKYGAAAQGIEETVADALRWISPVVRHVRTGEYAGTEVIVRRFGSMLERPRALTECGAKSTGADYSPVAAQSELINGGSHSMCPACRKKFEARAVRDLSHLSDPQAPITPKQRNYLRDLLDEGARNGRPCLLEAQATGMSARAASAMIDRLKALKERGWKGDL
jgi:hypothetical protein